MGISSFCDIRIDSGHCSYAPCVKLLVDRSYVFLLPYTSDGFLKCYFLSNQKVLLKITSL